MSRRILLRSLLVWLLALVLVCILLLAGCTQQPAVTPTHTPIPTPSPTPTPTSTRAPVSEPPTVGDWVVKGKQSVENRTISLNGNLIVRSGASLTLRGVTLIVNSTYDGEYGILAEPGSSLFVYESNVTSRNPQPRWYQEGMAYKPTGVSEAQSPRFTFRVMGAKFEMRQSELHGCGWGEPWGNWELENGGLWLENADNAIIVNNTFSNNFYGLILSNTDHATVRGNTLDHNDESAISLREASNNTISENVFSSNLFGIQALAAWKNILADNTFLEFFEAAVWLFGGG